MRLLDFVRARQSFKHIGTTTCRLIFRCMHFSKTGSPRRAGKRTTHNGKNTQVFGFDVLTNDFNYFHMQIRCSNYHRYIETRSRSVLRNKNHESRTKIRFRSQGRKIRFRGSALNLATEAARRGFLRPDRRHMMRSTALVEDSRVDCEKEEIWKFTISLTCCIYMESYVRKKLMGTSSVKEMVYIFSSGFHLNPFGMGPVVPKGPLGPWGQSRRSRPAAAGGRPSGNPG